MQDARRALLDPAHHLVHVLAGPDRRDVEQHVGVLVGLHLRHLAVDLEQLGGVLEEAGPRPVAPDLVGASGTAKQRLLAAGLAERLRRR